MKSLQMFLTFSWFVLKPRNILRIIILYQTIEIWCYIILVRQQKKTVQTIFVG